MLQMKINQMLRKSILKAIILFITFIGITSTVAAEDFNSESRFDFMWGTYSINGKSSRGTVSASGFTNYRFTYRKVLIEPVELFLGYNYLTSGFFSGDSEFGPEIGVNIYPYTQASTLLIDEPKLKLSIRETYRPYVAIGFHQRNFQSVNSNFVGFGFGVGTDIHHRKNNYFRTELRYLPLLGPDKSSANQIDLYFGYSLAY